MKCNTNRNNKGQSLPCAKLSKLNIKFPLHLRPCQLLYKWLTNVITQAKNGCTYSCLHPTSGSHVQNLRKRLHCVVREGSDQVYSQPEEMIFGFCCLEDCLLIRNQTRLFSDTTTDTAVIHKTCPSWVSDAFFYGSTIYLLTISHQFNARFARSTN